MGSLVNKQPLPKVITFLAASKLAFKLFHWLMDLHMIF